MDTTTAMETTTSTSAINNETAAALTAAAEDATVQCIWSETRWSSVASNEFFKFIARFSGRRRNLGINLEVIILLVIISLFSTSEACSSRTVPKQRPPPPTPTPRPNITFPTYACPSTYAAWYCLNSATCFSVKIGEEVLYNCECAVGYEGPRCEYKEIDGSYLPTRPRAMLEKASIASGATLALLVVIILCLTWYMRCQQKQKARRLESSDCGMDDVDGVVMMPEKRPFGPHHQYTLPMTSTFKR